MALERCPDAFPAVHLSLPANAFSPFCRLTCFDPLIRTTQPTCCYSISLPRTWWFCQIPEKDSG